MAYVSGRVCFLHADDAQTTVGITSEHFCGFVSHEFGFIASVIIAFPPKDAVEKTVDFLSFAVEEAADESGQ